MPYFLLLFTFVLIYVQPGTYFTILTTAKLSTIIPIVLFVISLFVRSRISHSDIWKNPTIKWLLYLLFLAILSLLFKEGYATLDKIKLVVGHIFLFYSICRIADTKTRLHGVFITLALCHITLIYLNPDLILKPEQRSYVQGVTFLGDGNDFALSLCIGFPLAVYLFLNAKKKYQRIVFLTFVIITVLAIIGTQSRGATLALGAILFYLWWKSQKKMLGIFAIGMLTITALLFAAPQYFARMSTLSNIHAESSAQGRIDAWKLAIGLAKENPILGVGAGNFGNYNRNHTAHSMYFLALGEFGLPGLFFIIFYFVFLLRSIKKRLKEIQNQAEYDVSYYQMFTYLNASILGFMVAGAFLSVLYYPHLYVLGALVFVAHRCYELDSIKNDEEELLQDNFKNEISARQY